MNKNIIRQILSDFFAIWLWIFFLLLLLMFWYFIIDVKALDLNFGRSYTIVHIVLHVLLAILVWWIITLQVYKIRQNKKIFKEKSDILSIFWVFFWVLITWCPVCWRTLVSALGISTLLNFLPRYGLEIKLLSVFFLFWAQDILLSNVDKCQIFNFKLWFLKKRILFSILFLILSIFFISYMIRIENFVDLPWNTKLIPSKDYNIFTYELKDWCSNSSFFVETFTQTNKSTKILWLYVYDLETIEKFANCKHASMSFELNNLEFKNIIEKYGDKNNSNLKLLNNTKYFVNYNNCEDFQFEYCLEWKYRFVKNNVIYKIVANIVSWNVLSQENSILYLDEEISKRQIK